MVFVDVFDPLFKHLVFLSTTKIDFSRFEYGIGISGIGFSSNQVKYSD